MTFTGANTATPSFTAPTGPATLQFELTVTDDTRSDTDSVVVNVEAPPNQPPTADAGPDQTVASGASVTLNGNGSTDTDGTIASYAWTQTVGPNVTLTGANTATPSFTAPTGPATLTFELEVCDSEPLCDTDTVVITVNAPGTGSSATFPNACENSVTANNSQIGVTMSADAPASAAPGQSLTLTNIQQSLDLPGSIFVAGYNLGLLTIGPNTVPATVSTRIEGTNTLEGTQDTNTASTSVSTTISDPDGPPGTGDETATPGALSVTYADQTWTADTDGGTIDFREDTVTPLAPARTAAHRRRQGHRGDRTDIGPLRLRPGHRQRAGSGHGHLRRPGGVVCEHDDRRWAGQPAADRRRRPRPDGRLGRRPSTSTAADPSIPTPATPSTTPGPRPAARR